MGDEALHTALAHVALACVAGPSLSRMSDRSYTHPGVFGNFIIHGVLGAMHNQAKTFGNVEKPYKISLQASKYLPLPCLMADVYRGNRELSLAHLISGAVPFALAVAGNDNEQLGNLCVAANIISLAWHSFDRDRRMGYATAGCGVLAYFVAANTSKLAYPLSLAAMAYFIDQFGGISVL